MNNPQDVLIRDGYRVHVNPDGSCCFLEGIPDNRRPYFKLTAEEGMRIEVAHIEHGLNQYTKFWNWRLRRKMRKLWAIMKLETELCGEESYW